MESETINGVELMFWMLGVFSFGALIAIMGELSHIGAALNRIHSALLGDRP